MNLVGARSHGVDLPRELQELGCCWRKKPNLQRGLERHEISNKTHNYERRTVWSNVVARVTTGAVSGEILDSELARGRNENSGTHSIGRRTS